MLRNVFLFFLLSSFLQVNAYYPKYNNFSNNNGFQSKLKMNQPKVIIDGYRDYNLNPDRRYRGHRRHCCNNRYAYLSDKKLGDLEKYTIGKKFTKDSNLERLERLEELAFGSVQSGNLPARYKKLERAVYSRPKCNHRQSVLGKIANYFAGDVTGFTPGFSPQYFTQDFSATPVSNFNSLGGYNNFYPAPGYSNNNYEQYSNGIFGGGYGISGHDYGSGTTIRMLD